MKPSGYRLHAIECIGANSLIIEPANLCHASNYQLSFGNRAPAFARDEAPIPMDFVRALTHGTQKEPTPLTLSPVELRFVEVDRTIVQLCEDFLELFERE